MNSFVSLSPSRVAPRPSLVMDQLPGHLAPHPAGIAADDWDVLFRAVRARLRSTVAGPVTAASADLNSVLRTQDAVLDCVEALECLHAALDDGRGGIRRGFFQAG